MSELCRSRSAGTSMPSDLICTGSILVRNNLMNQKANSVDPDQMARMCRLIWINIVCPRNKGLSMEERVKQEIHTPPPQCRSI